MSTTFAQLGVPSFICDALARRGITDPFEIQAATVADGLAGRDVCGRAPTGSGKTLAFGVPMVANVAALGRSQPRRPVGLVLAPTRELAEQITIELRSFAGNVRIEPVYGGVGYGGQLGALRRGVDILVACPGRLEDLIQRRDVDLREVRFVVLDEADRMADMGFMPSVRRLLDQTPNDRQTVLFSATLDGDIAKLTAEYQSNPVRHEVGDATPDIKSAIHKFWNVERLDRNPVVADIVKAAWPSIIFCRTRHGADRLAKQLAKLDLKAAPIHGGRSQSQRNRALDDFMKGRVHALVATDVAARGIHVDGVASVIHYDPPEDHKAYVHRSGRTARAGAEGFVVSIVQPGQKNELQKMQRAIGLDEPFTLPDAGMFTGAALPGDRQLAPAGPPAREPQARNRSTNRPRHVSNTSKTSKTSTTSNGRRRRNGATGRSAGATGRSADNRKARRVHLQP
jgi:superfamily II DNA/RNA helicase